MLSGRRENNLASHVAVANATNWLHYCQHLCTAGPLLQPLHVPSLSTQLRQGKLMYIINANLYTLLV